MTPKARTPVRRTFEVTYRVTTTAVVDDLRRAQLYVPHTALAPTPVRFVRAVCVPKP